MTKMTIWIGMSLLLTTTIMKPNGVESFGVSSGSDFCRTSPPQAPPKRSQRTAIRSTSLCGTSTKSTNDSSSSSSSSSSVTTMMIHRREMMASILFGTSSFVSSSWLTLTPLPVQASTETPLTVVVSPGGDGATKIDSTTISSTKSLTSTKSSTPPAMKGIEIPPQQPAATPSMKAPAMKGGDTTMITSGSGAGSSTTTTTSTKNLPNPGDTKNCSDFVNYSEAKTWYDRYFPLYGDVARLDGNNDGIPCESLPGSPKQTK